MQIPPQALHLNLSLPGNQTQTWQPGQLLEAVVIRADAGNQRTDLRVGGLQLSLTLPNPPAEGTRLTLQVVRGGTRPVVTLLAQAPPVTDTRAAAPSATAGPPPSAPWLSSLMPAQGSQVPLLATLWALSQQPARMASLPSEVRAGVHAVMDQLPRTADVVRPGGLQQAVQASGLFHEAGLAVRAATVGTTAATIVNLPILNLKSVLLSLAARIRSLPATAAQAAPGTRPMDVAPPRAGDAPLAQARMEVDLSLLGREALMDALRARAEAAVARLALHQWSAVESTDAGLPRWLMELPLRSDQGIDLVHLLMEREPERSGGQDEPVWRAELALDLPELGPLHVHIAVSGERVRTLFWADSQETVDRIRAALPRLREALEDRRLAVGSLSCNPGPPAQTGRPTATPLLDDHA